MALHMCGQLVVGPNGIRLQWLREKVWRLSMSLLAKNMVSLVLVHVGHQCILDAQELARHAESIGADAVSVLPPFAPERPGNIDVLINILARIAGAAPNTPFYYYHMPGVTSLSFSMTELLTKSKNIVPTFTGIKYVSSDLDDFHKALQLPCTYQKGCPDGHYLVFWAQNPKIQSLQYGASAFVLAENYYAGYMKGVYDAWQTDPTEAAELQAIYNEVMDCVKDSKSVMKMLGLDLGPPRLPGLPLDPNVYLQMCDCLLNVGFFQQLQVPNPNCNPA